MQLFRGGRRRKTTILLVAAALAAAGTGTAIALVLIVRGPEHKQTTLTRHHLSPAQVARVHTGITKAQLRALLGKPAKVQLVSYPDPGEYDNGAQECWVYDNEPPLTTPMYQFCFWAGRLSTKASYGG